MPPTREDIPPGRGWAWLGAWAREFRYAARSLRRAPGFSVAVFLTLVVCIGPNTAILSALYALVLKPLPFADPQQLVRITNVAEKNNGQVTQSSEAQYRDFRDHADLFAGFALIKPENVTLDDEGAPVRVENDWVTAGFFDVLGVKPVLGRFFTADEETPGKEQVLVITQSFWESHYHADPGVVGREIRPAGTPYTIIGVAPRSIQSLWNTTCFFQPYAPPPLYLNPQARYTNDAILYGRLKPGVPLAAGLAQLTTLERRFRQEVANPRLRAAVDAAGFRLAVTRLRVDGAAAQAKSLGLLQAGALLVLLIGCVNVVNLCLARANARQGELAIRVALGAGRAALVRPMLAESLLLTGAASIAGLGLAMAALRGFNGYLPILVRTAPPVALDPLVAGLILAVAFAIAILIGLLPLQLVWRAGLRIGATRSSSSGGAARAVSGLLVIAQVAVAAMLLVGASLLIRSFAKVLAVDPGFDAAHIVQGRIALPSRYAADAANLAMQRRVLESFREMPGVSGVAEVSGFTLAPTYRTQPFIVRGQPVTEGDSQPSVILYPVSPDFFATMGVRVLEGRAFNDADDFSKDPVVIVDENFATRYFPGRLVVGQEITLGSGPPGPGTRWARIVGVVKRANLTSLDSHDPTPFLYLPMNGWRMGGFNVLVHSPRPADEVVREMRARLRALDPGVPFYLAQSLQDGLDEMLMSRRGITLLLGAFSALSLVLAAIGLYGVLSYDVSQRTREIGIRGAIGASRGQILALILHQGMWKTGAGLAVGVVGALLLTRYLKALLYDVAAVDAASYALVLLLLLAIALLACWLPARKASRVDPIVALRAE